MEKSTSAAAVPTEPAISAKPGVHGAEPPVAHGIERFLADRGSGLLRAAWLLTGDDQHAEDLFQTALVKSLGKYDALTCDHKFESYLRTTIYRTFVSWWRRKSWGSETVTVQVPEQADDHVSTEERVDVLRALDTLPRMQRAVLSLRSHRSTLIGSPATTTPAPNGSPARMPKPISMRGRRNTPPD